MSDADASPGAPDPTDLPSVRTGLRLAPAVYDLVGGLPFFEALVERFYAGVETDPVLRALYPEADLAPARRRLTLFLVQYWGGPTTYSAERGHPRLRSRHFQFPIGSDERDRWLAHMQAAVEVSGATPEIAGRLMRYFEQAAEAVRNLER
jgi:hemoglobin